MLTIVFVLFLFASNVESGTANKTKHIERDIYVHFLNDDYNNYLKESLPINVVEEPMPCYLRVSLASVLKVEPSAEQLVLQLSIEKEWHDDYFKWNPKDWSNITDISILSANIWSPDLEAYGTNVKTYYEQYARIQSNGTLSTEFTKVVNIFCTFNLEYFPFDVQLCHFYMGSGRYKRKELKFIHRGEPDTVWKTNAEWRVLKFAAANVSDNVTKEFPDEWTEFPCYLAIQRNANYYVIVILIPTFLIATISLIGLFAPHDSNGEREEKVSFGLGTLLAMSVILSMVADQTPRTSLSMPLLARYVVSEIFVITLAIAITVIIVYVHERARRRQSMPPNWLRRLLFCECCGTSDGTATALALKAAFEEADKATDEKHVSSVEMRQVLKILRKIGDEIDENSKNDECARRWQKVLRRLDLTLMAVFQILNIFVTVALLVPGFFHGIREDELQEWQEHADEESF